MKPRVKLLSSTIFFIFCCRILFGQELGDTYKSLNVADGLPQSYVSGIVQDRKDFIWIATRDGLSKYDGKKFVIFRDGKNNPYALSSNIITNLFLDRSGKLWIFYEQGDLDIIDTDTEKVTRLTADKNFRLLRDKSKSGQSMIQISDHIYWILGRDGVVYTINYAQKKINAFTSSQLLKGLPSTFITGIAWANQNIILTTSQALIYMRPDGRILKTVDLSFSKTGLYNPKRNWKDNSALVRKNGELIIPDEDRLILYDSLRNNFKIIDLPKQQYYIIPPRVMDKSGNVFVGYANMIFQLDSANSLLKFKSETAKDMKNISMFLDKSNVLWAGTNGYGIRQYDLYLTQIPKLDYTSTFHEQIIEKLNIPAHHIKQTFLHGISTYFFRWTRGIDGKIWMAKAGADSVKTPNLIYYQNGKLVLPKWKYSTTSPRANVGINALAVSQSGKLWGIDNSLRPVFLDTNTYTVQAFNPIHHRFDKNKLNEVNGFVIDGEHTFWISSTLGLMKYDQLTGRVIHYFSKEPQRQLMTVCQDPFEKDILWLGTYSDGLIRFNKTTAICQYYTKETGLPNNTVYSILPDQNGLLWCSSNKGVFSINPKSGKVRSYVTKGEIPVDEFNRFHYFSLPDKQMAFGGTEGYTLFDPESLVDDTYEPKIALTNIKINNKNSSPDDPETPVTGAINSLEEIVLPYDKNFLAFEFAALQYNIPEKLQYRYMLSGLDDGWVMAGTDNVATYTTIPPGSYTLKINASNTAGIWSRHVKSVRIIITPPFWKTLWFMGLCFLFFSGLMYFLVKRRIKNIREKDLERMAFEREAMELEAQAMRSQMNPHFIFNCLNSIKSLIQEDDKNNAVVYLTTFAKLIRNQLYNNQREISLHDEITTCRLYLQLETLRFGDRIAYEFNIDQTADLHRIMVPPLILQPFIENSIIHGILPRPGKGRIILSIVRQNDDVICSIDDDGVGRVKANQDRELRKPNHVSKGTLLVETRLNMHNSLNRNNFSIRIIDKTDEFQNPSGTCVILTFNPTL